MRSPINERASAPTYKDLDLGFHVFLCGRCGQPFAAPHDLCASAMHVGSDGLGVGHAIASTELARLAGAARVALGARR